MRGYLAGVERSVFRGIFGNLPGGYATGREDNLKSENGRVREFPPGFPHPSALLLARTISQRRAISLHWRARSEPAPQLQPAFRQPTSSSAALDLVPCQPIAKNTYRRGRSRWLPRTPIAPAPRSSRGCLTEPLPSPGSPLRPMRAPIFRVFIEPLRQKFSCTREVIAMLRLKGRNVHRASMKRSELI